MGRVAIDGRGRAMLIVWGSLMASGLAQAQVATVYSNLPPATPPNVPSLGYQATSTAEWGDHVTLGGSQRRAANVTVLMSSWSLKADYPSLPAAGYQHPITVNLYAVNTSGPTPTLGALLGSVSQTFLIPWRPVADPTCAGGTAWRAGDGNCYNGYAFPISFDLRSLGLNLPNQVIVGVAYNTNTWGYNPLLAPGPYESLNVGTSAAVAPAGADAEPDATFWNTSFAGFYTDGGAGGVGIFRRDTGWTGFATALEIKAYTVATTADACKGGGWANLARADGSAFKNQGDCVSYTKNGK